MGVVVAFMAWRAEAKAFEKAMWMLLIFAFLIIEMKAIREDRAKQDQAERQARAEENANFNQIVHGITETLEQNSRQFDSTMARTQVLLSSTTKISRVSRKSLDLVLIGLRPQLSAAPSDALEQSQPFSVPFVVKNQGLLPVQRVVVNCYIRHLQAAAMNMTGKFGDLMGNRDWRFAELDRGESKTVVCPFLRTSDPIRSADLSVIVEYEDHGVPYRSIFRYVGQYGDRWRWLPQPSEDIRSEIDEVLKNIRPKQYSH